MSISLPSQGNEDPSFQARAMCLQQLIDYIGKPFYLLTCRSYRVALPLSRIPAHSIYTKTHSYNRKDCVNVLESWKAMYLPSYPVKMFSEGDLRAWTPPPTTPLAPIPQLITLHAFYCRYSYPTTYDQFHSTPKFKFTGMFSLLLASPSAHAALACFTIFLPYSSIDEELSIL